MLLRELFEDTTRPVIPEIITAYHGGTGFTGEFNLSFSGTGEGYRILGPGIYFTTDKGQAAHYAVKYGRNNPTVYTAKINTDNFYDNNMRPTEKMVASLTAIAQELGYKDDDALPRQSQSLTYGRGSIGDIVKAAGFARAQTLFVKYGLNGAVELLPGNIWEISVFNLKMMKVIEKESVDQKSI